MADIETPTACPDPSVGETKEDCPWAVIARTLIIDDQAGRPLMPTFKALLPKLAKQIEKDSKQPEIKKLWGMSINYDELAQGTIVQEPILKTIAALFGTTGVPQSKTTNQGHPVVHAGMEHTYGYLFSLLQTQFGYKRARWVRPEIAQGFGLAPSALGPEPEKGSLFKNVSYLAGSIAFQGEPSELKILKSLSKEVPAELVTLASKPFTRMRLEETITLPRPKKNRVVTLRTDFVEFTHPSKAPNANTHVLVYSIRDSAEKSAKLITLFPVQKSFVDKVMNPAELGEDKPISTRYNAFVDGVTGVASKGTRKNVSHH